MKILVVMKRFGANKDMVMQDFGRQVNLFKPLAKKHKIDFLCPDYVKKDDKVITRKGIRFIIKPFGFFSIFKFLKYMKKLFKNEKYDAIVATTDPLIGALCNNYSRKYKIPMVYDLQDNFEVYDTYRIPFIPYFHKKAVKEAEAVLTVSESLKNYISKTRRKPTFVIQNGIDLSMFRPIDKIKSRKKLKLPLKSKIIVYVGHLERLKGADVLLDAFSKVRQRCPDTYLLLSGQVDKSIDIKQKNIIFREFPKREEVVLGINAADVAIIPNPSNGFTKYCFPYKLAEYMACNVPIVATGVGDVSLMLKNQDNSLCKPGNPDDLAEKIILQFENNKKAGYDIKKFDWILLSEKLNDIMKQLN